MIAAGIFFLSKKASLKYSLKSIVISIRVFMGIVKETEYQLTPGINVYTVMGST